YRNPCNNSYSIENGTFSQLINLTLLSLKSNNLSFIPPQLPTSLKELYLYNNNIQNVTNEDFKSLTNLEILDISGNCPRCYNAPFPCTPCPNNSPLKISKMAFKMLTKLKTLRLHSNSLTFVQSEWFTNTKELKVLDLSTNFLASDIGDTRFPHFLGKLEELDLSFNYELQRYPQTLTLSRSFSSLRSLKILRLKGFVFQQLRPENLGTNFIKMANLSILMELKSFKIISLLSDNKISSPSDGQDTVELGVITSFVKRKCSRFGKTLDVSRNNIFFLHSRFLNLRELRCLNLSGNLMSQSLNGSEFTYLTNLKYLDFSSNRLDLLYSTAFQELKSLVILDISNNNHYFESEELESQSLERLEFKDNRLDVLWRDGDTRYFSYFKKLFNLTFLDISQNNLNLFQRKCSAVCQTNVTCDAPGAQKGHPVISVDLLACQHNYLSIILYILMTSLILSLLTLSISSHLFLWDVWYIYHFCRAKLKGYNRLYSQSCVYDAFVIYDKEDPAVSEWVMKEMCVHLEDREDHCLRLCLEERDWIPGCPLIDNLSQSIHRSKRTVFILTKKYIKSGNFKTAFYIAHQRLMDEKNDVIYLKLRKRLYKRSVLEWPTNPQAQPYFWFQLRNVLALKVTNNTVISSKRHCKYIL
uniref:Toll like receptor 7 n=1 Tax=Lates calcarifer TaxID=8187 RepID=A0A4W6FFY8_LATCA